MFELLLANKIKENGNNYFGEWVQLTYPMVNNWSNGQLLTHDGYVYVLGGYSSNSVYNTALWRYNITTNLWESKAAFVGGRIDFACGVVDNKIYIIGGANESGNQRGVSCYDIATDTWSAKAAIYPTNRVKSYDSCTVNNKIYIIGGSILGASVNYNYIYNPATDAFEYGALRPAGIQVAATFVMDDTNIISAMGQTPENTQTNKVYKLDTVANTWSVGVPPVTPESLSFVKAVTINNKGYTFGGFIAAAIKNTAYVYDGLEWGLLSSRTTVPPGRISHGWAAYGEKAYLMGGRNMNGSFNDFWVFTPSDS